MGFKLCALMILACLAVNCRSTSGNSNLRVLDGQLLAENDELARSTVLLGSRDDEGKASFHCSASLIAPNLVVTAAHCLHGKSMEELVVRFGVDFYKEPAREGTPIQMKWHERYDDDNSTLFDIGWVLLKEPAPEGSKPLEILRSGETLETGRLITLIGAGRTKTGCTEKDCLSLMRTIDQKVENLFEKSHYPNMIVISPEANRGLCHGDSGGPAVVELKGQRYLAGVFHGFDRALTGYEGQIPNPMTPYECEKTIALSTFAGYYVPWIEETSGQKLAWNESLNPRRTFDTDPLMAKDDKGTTFQDLMRYTNFDDELWKTASLVLTFLRSDLKLSFADSLRIEKDFDFAWEKAQEVKSFGSYRYDGEGYSFSSDYTSAITDARPVSFLANLESLDLANLDLPDYSSFARLSNLRNLRISAIRKTSKWPPDPAKIPMKSSINLGFLGGLGKLETLDLSNNLSNLNIGSFPKTGLETIKVLSLADNPWLTDISQIPWELFKNLEVLNLKDCSVKDISPLKVLPKLMELNLTSNHVEDVEPLAEIQSLKSLNLAYNNYSKLGKVLELPHLDWLDATSDKGPTKEKCPERIKRCRI